MKIETGTMLGPYRIEESIGAGGMGEVFRARDTRLERDVAVKVIPPSLASNEQLLARFEREAKVVSSLSHPNICVLHDVGKQGDGEEPLHYFVMELVDGETLDERIRRGRIPTPEAIAIGIQIARALEHAHARGVVHRDLKPSNVMLTSSGVKLLDFGLSRMLRESEDELANEHSRTVQRGITEEGVVLGTFQYMAPEQAEGKKADVRTDLFALGAILYEMVTGRRAFEGKSRASLIAAIMAIDPPDVTELRPEAPPALEKVIGSCLEKDPEERWQSAHDVRIALELAASDRGATRGIAESSRWRTVLPWIVAALAIIIAIAMFFFRQTGDEREGFAFEILPGDLRYSWDSVPVSISPDGRSLIVGMDEPGGTGGVALYVRDLESLEFRKLGPQGMLYDAGWSWDGQEILFFQDFEMKKISASGGPVTTLAETGDSRGASWAPGGQILFVPELTMGIHVVPSAGGEARRVTTVDQSAGEISHARPAALPDGEHFLFLVNSSDPARRGIHVGSLDGGAHRFLIGSQSAPVFAAPDRVLYMHEGSLYAQTLDMDELVPVGSPQRVADRVAYSAEFDNPGYSASRTGVLAYHPSSSSTETAIHVYDRSGNQLQVHPMSGNNLDLSLDDERLAVQSAGDQAPDLWIWELQRGIRTRLTSADGGEIGPVWSPDGRWIAFSAPGNPTKYFRKRASGLGESELIVEGGRFGGQPIDWSSDGRWILVELFTQENQTDMNLVDLEADTPVMAEVISTRFDESSGRFSHDMRWIAYQANDSGRYEIFVQPFPPDGSRWQVSPEGGSDPRWRADGRELYWISRGAVMAADVDLSDGFNVGNIRKLFDAPSSDWDVDSAGETFLITEGAIAATTPIVIDTDW